MQKYLILVFAFLLSACQTQGPKETGGMIAGAGLGALAGSQFGKGDGRLVSVALGTLLGSQIGASIGRQMDAEDHRLANNTAYHALERLPDNQPTTWRNPNNYHSGQFMVTSTNTMNKDLVCRDYVHTVIIDGQQEKVYGRACRNVHDSRAQWMAQ